MLIELRSEDPDVFVLIEDDGQVAYAYYYYKGAICGFVWLYNRALPVHGVLRPRGEPQLNEFSIQSPVVGDLPSDFQAHWIMWEGVLECAIYVKGRITAQLGRGDNPGWCKNASQDGPFAQVLEVPTS